MAKNRIILIEDEGELVMLIKNYLEERGFDLECFLSGKEGLAAIREKKPDLVLLDLKLPDINGMDIYAKLRLDKDTKSIPIVFVTASCMIGDIEKAFRMGVDDYVCKPVELDYLLNKVKKILKIK